MSISGGLLGLALGVGLLLIWRSGKRAPVRRSGTTRPGRRQQVLAAAGLTPDDVDFVINTHLHFDHAGNNWLFTAATIFVQREQYEFADGHEAFPNQYWNVPGLRYELVDGRREVLPGVEVLPTPGHVPGHQSVVLTLPATGTVVLAGDAVHVQASYELDNWDGHLDPAAARDSAAMLLRLARERDAVYLLGHEPAQVQQYPRFPHVFR